MEDVIKLRGVRVHNLKNVNLDIPKNKLVVITGVSGSGKSSLAFDTVYAEAERRYLESLSGYARQFLGMKDRPDYDKIEGLSPAIAIDQHSISKNPRSTVATTTEIYDYMRILFSRIGTPHCPQCGRLVSKQTHQQVVKSVFEAQKKHAKANAGIVMLAPIAEAKKGEHKGLLQEISHAGFVFVRFDATLWRIDELLEKDISKQEKHTIEVVIDRLLAGEEWEKLRVSEDVERALKIGKGFMKLAVMDQKFAKPMGEDMLFSEQFACVVCNISYPAVEPRLFSFNTPYGACPECTGLGYLIKVDPNLVMPNKNLTLGEGAVFPWMTASHRVGRQGWYWYKLSEVAEAAGFSMQTQVKDLPQWAIDVILYGAERAMGKQKAALANIDFEGVIPNLERRWRETDSEFARQEIEKYMTKVQCPVCNGKRLNKFALSVKIQDSSIEDAAALSVEAAYVFFSDIAKMKPSNSMREVAAPLAKEIIKRLKFMLDIGLGYLTLNRESTTLAGGEAQRIKLATQIGSGLSGVLYVLDEPSIGLHARDINKLIATLKELRDLGNTVLVVEHDEQTIRAADWVIDVGPGAGETGGTITFEGTPAQLLKSKSLTGEYLSGRKNVTDGIEKKEKALNGKLKRAEAKQETLVIKGAAEHNLKNIDVSIPLGKFVCVSGVSGSGKSSLINDILAPALMREFYRSKEAPGKHERIEGIEHLDKVIVVDQSPIGRTPRSNPATYTGVFDLIRDIYTETKLARMRGYDKGRFSFNVKGGRCDACDGQGYKKIEMYFLPDVYVECDECHGTRYRQEILEIEYHGKNIAEVLNMTVTQARKFFASFPMLVEKLKLIEEVGLGYVHLGQPATTLSGGEAQRMKLSSELSKKQTGNTLYILDEPTTGLHFDDVQKLLAVLKSLVSRGNTVLVVEHELDIIRNADWVIDLGPEGGEAGGQLIAQGTPRDIMKAKKSYTGKYIASKLE